VASAELAAALASVFAALGLTPGDADSRRLLDYLALLQRWNATYNLTSVRDPAQMLVQHLADCMTVIAPMTRELPQGRVLDVGSGGGLPGVVIAALCPRLDVTCVDTVGKKAAFVRQVAGQLGLPNLHALHGRVEAMRAPGFDLVTARAFSSLADFTTLTRPHLLPGGVWMAMKGRPPREEVAALPPTVEVFHVEPLQVPGLDAERCLVWMRPNAESPTAVP
jgi:16S rRNA (guanine527-N7)-methyltransferase